MSEKDPHSPNYEDRLRRLEQKLDDLQKRMEVLERERGIGPETNAEKGSNPDTVREENLNPRQGEINRFIERGSWLNKVGLALLLLGVIFLFKYSVEQGWITPLVRSLFGLTLGGILLISGLAMRSEQRRFRQVLLGGGVATFYITGFATYNFYQFLPASATWIFIIAVTLLSLALSLQQDESLLSLIGTIGGLATPFLIYRGAGSFPGLIMYTCMVLSGAAIIYFYKEWLNLLLVSFLGSMLIFGISLFYGVLDPGDPPAVNRWALQAGLVFELLVFWLLPMLREWLTHAYPDQWASDHPASRESIWSIRHLHVYPAFVPVLLLYMSMWTWNLEPWIWGSTGIAVAVVWGALFKTAPAELPERLRRAHLYGGVLLVTGALFLLLEGPLLALSYGVEILLIMMCSYYLEDRALEEGGHVLALVVGIWLLKLLIEPNNQLPVLFHLEGSVELSLIAVLGIAAPIYIRSNAARRFYIMTAHLAFLGWVINEFVHLQLGQAFITISWGIYTAILLVIGYANNRRTIRLLGFGTTFLVVGKLLLVDLAQLSAIWRILLFLGFGGSFLLISYFLRGKLGSSS